MFHSAFECPSAFLLGSCLLYGRLFPLSSPTISSHCSASKVLTPCEDAVHSAGLAPEAFRGVAGPGRLWGASDLMTHISTDSYSQILTCSFQGIQWGHQWFGSPKGSLQLHKSTLKNLDCLEPSWKLLGMQNKLLQEITQNVIEIKGLLPTRKVAIILVILIAKSWNPIICIVISEEKTQELYSIS